MRPPPEPVTVAPRRLHTDKHRSILRITAVQARPLRHEILRPEQPLEACVYPGDDLPTSAHFGAVVGDGELVGVASVYNESQDGGLDPFSWRLRGMATRDDVRGHGYGAALVAACVRYATDQGGLQLWCNGRTTVAEFYQRYGFEPCGDVFDLPGIGPHIVLQRPL